MVKTRRRALSLFLVVFLPEIVLLVLGFYYVSSLAAYFGMPITSALLVVFLPIWSIGMILVLLWHHFALKLPLSPFKRSLLHPRVIKERIGKAMMLILALLVLESLSNLDKPLTFLLFIAVVLSSWYSIIVEFELSHDFAEYTSLYNPLKRKDEL